MQICPVKVDANCWFSLLPFAKLRRSRIYSNVLIPCSMWLLKSQHTIRLYLSVCTEIVRGQNIHTYKQIQYIHTHNLETLYPWKYCVRCYCCLFYKRIDWCMKECSSLLSLEVGTLKRLCEGSTWYSWCKMCETSVEMCLANLSMLLLWA